MIREKKNEGRTRLRIMKNYAMMAVGLLAFAALPVFAAPISFPECPAVGHDTSGCELLITVTATNGSGIATAFNVTTSSPDLGPFDGIDDTLIGVLNSAPGGLFQVFFNVGGSPETFAGANKDGACFGTAGVALYSPAPTAAQCLQGHFWTTDLNGLRECRCDVRPLRHSNGRLFLWSVGSRRIHMVQLAGRPHRHPDYHRRARAGLADSYRNRTGCSLFHSSTQSLS